MGNIENEIKDDRKKIIPGILVWLKKYWILVVILGGLQAIPATYLGVYMADRPWFCALMCHNMVPHYETFAASSHGKNAVGGDMTCMDCHSKQGFFNHLTEHVVASQFMIPNITKPYLYDHTDIHKNVEGFKKKEWDFRGKSYVEEKELFKECQKECHTKRIGLSYFMLPTAHGYELINDNCRRCHEQIAQQAEVDLEKAKALLHEVSPQNPWKYPEPQALPNMHPLHLGMGVECVTCHSRIIHSTEADKKHTPGMERCFRCHDNEKAARDNCPACHVNPRDLFAGVKGQGIEEMPGMMVETECTECHSEDDAYKVFPEVCVDCHDEDYPQNIVDWRKKWEDNYKDTRKTYNKVKTLLEKRHRAGRSVSTVSPIFKKAEYNYWYAARDNSRGIHNPDFTEALFESANNGLNECMEMMKR